MDIKFWFYIFLFVVIGIPLIGFAVRNLIRFGKYVYRSFPFMQRFFDEYYEHFALGSVITIICVVVWAILHFWVGVV